MILIATYVAIRICECKAGPRVLTRLIGLDMLKWLRKIVTTAPNKNLALLF